MMNGQKGLDFSFRNVKIPEAHPNTAMLKVEGEGGRKAEVQASSPGGGRIMYIDGGEI